MQYEVVDLPELRIHRPEAKFSISSSIGIPFGERCHPTLKPRPLYDEVSNCGCRHTGETAEVIRGLMFSEIEKKLIEVPCTVKLR